MAGTSTFSSLKLSYANLIVAIYSSKVLSTPLETKIVGMERLEASLTLSSNSIILASPEKSLPSIKIKIPVNFFPEGLFLLTFNRGLN